MQAISQLTKNIQTVSPLALTDKSPAHVQLKRNSETRIKTSDLHLSSSESDEEPSSCSERDQSVDSDANVDLPHHQWVEKPGRFYQSGVRLPPYTGKEKWKVWYNRFAEVAELKKWSEKEKLAEILPKLQGEAGEFVFGQLPKSARRSYKTLVVELGNRYRVIRTKQSCCVQFSRRDQHSGERVEDHAAELKKLYDYAYPHRHANTRKEDLLRRFLDGLVDDEASFQVEYVKTPANIDEAVYEIVNFKEKRGYSKQKSSGDRSSKRRTQIANSEDDFSSHEDFSDNQRVARAGDSKLCHIPSQHPPNGPSTEKEKSSIEADNSLVEKCLTQISKLSEQVEKLVVKNEMKNNSRDFHPAHVNRDRKADIECYACRRRGHYARDCIQANNQAKRSFHRKPNGPSGMGSGQTYDRPPPEAHRNGNTASTMQNSEYVPAPQSADKFTGSERVHQRVFSPASPPFQPQSSQQAGIFTGSERVHQGVFSPAPPTFQPHSSEGTSN